MLGVAAQKSRAQKITEVRPPAAADLPAEAESEGGANLCEIRF
jgi:hypothetical protein